MIFRFNVSRLVCPPISEDEKTQIENHQNNDKRESIIIAASTIGIDGSKKGIGRLLKVSIPFQGSHGRPSDQDNQVEAEQNKKAPHDIPRSHMDKVQFGVGVGLQNLFANRVNQFIERPFS
jgi:hypothetical protein